MAFNFVPTLSDHIYIFTYWYSTSFNQMPNNSAEWISLLWINIFNPYHRCHTYLSAQTCISNELYHFENSFPLVNQTLFAGPLIRSMTFDWRECNNSHIMWMNLMTFLVDQREFQILSNVAYVRLQKNKTTQANHESS